MEKDNPQAPWQFRHQNHEQQNGNKSSLINKVWDLVGFKKEAV